MAVSQLDATHNRAKIKHHVYQCHDQSGVIGSLYHFLPWPGPLVRPVSWPTDPAWLDRSVASPH